MCSDSMFTYNELKIISAVPIGDITRYLAEIGAGQISNGVYSLGAIKIMVTPIETSVFAAFDMPRHEISVTGDHATAERFLTGFRLRFLTLGG